GAAWFSGHGEHLAERGRRDPFRVPSAGARSGCRAHPARAVVRRGALRPLPRAGYRGRSRGHRLDGSAMRLVRWQGEDLLRRLDDVIAVYGAAMGYSVQLLRTRPVVARPGPRGAAARAAQVLADRLLRARRAARPAGHAGPEDRRPPALC